MANTPRIRKAEITGLSGYLLKRFSRKLLGDVAEPAEVMWHNRPVLSAVMGVGRKAQKWDRLDPHLKSFANMAVAAKVGCSWCLDFGYFHAHNQGLDETKASEVPRWRESSVFTSLERDVMEYAEAMTETPPRVTDELFARLVKRLGDAAMVELTAVVALENMATRSNTAFGIESQGFSKACTLPLARPAAGSGTSPSGPSTSTTASTSPRVRPARRRGADRTP
jgi:AhpD family alkylhydroperoxidase